VGLNATAHAYLNVRSNDAPGADMTALSDLDVGENHSAGSNQCRLVDSRRGIDTSWRSAAAPY